MTDLDGKFSIEVTGKDEIEISYIGYKTQTIEVGDLGVLNVKMEGDNEVLDEVVVVGAGTQKKVSITGAITATEGIQLKAPTSSLTSSLAGKLAGVISTNSSGEPGSTSSFYIRGINTFGGCGNSIDFVGWRGNIVWGLEPYSGRKYRKFFGFEGCFGDGNLW